MGLCKCPKKKVTNLFCFEHRVNVCEHCLVSNHPKCIVQSYLQWLQDSDYNPFCTLCNQKLADEECGACVRLICYDVFHWRCLDAYARRLPANTAPAGYTCPTCKSGLFPASNIVSPVAESLRQLLSEVNWARAGLGMPLIEEPPPAEPVVAKTEAEPNQSVPNSTPQQQVPATANNQNYPAAAYASHSVVSVDDATPYARGADKADFNPRKLFDSTGGDHLLNMSHDHDEDKYKRRPALQWLTRWFMSRSGKQKQKDPNATFKKFAIVLVFGILGFLTLVVIFTRVGRASADNDPFLDPMANPNIRVEGN